MAAEKARRPRAKTVSAPAAARVKMSASVHTETYLTLATHALYSGLTQGQLIDRLVKDGCKRYRVSDYGEGKPSPAAGPDPSESADETAAA